MPSGTIVMLSRSWRFGDSRASSALRAAFLPVTADACAREGCGSWGQFVARLLGTIRWTCGQRGFYFVLFPFGPISACIRGSPVCLGWSKDPRPLSPEADSWLLSKVTGPGDAVCPPDPTGTRLPLQRPVLWLPPTHSAPQNSEGAPPAPPQPVLAWALPVCPRRPLSCRLRIQQEP